MPDSKGGSEIHIAHLKAFRKKSEKMSRMFRLLRADEIECRVQRVTEKGFSVLLYKDARCDMNILDETVGAMNWQRKHYEHNGNLFCAVGIWDEQKKDWVWKEDAGAPSNVDAEKGHSSDAYKRACVNFSIGRELYSAPFIWIFPKDEEIVKGKNGKPQLSPKVKLHVSEIIYDDNDNIKSLTIVDEHGNVRFPARRGAQNAAQNNPPAPQNDPPATIPADKAEWIQGACEALFGYKWKRMFWKATGYQDPVEVKETDYAEIRKRLETALNKANGGDTE